jgi:hypothetical protein
MLADDVAVPAHQAMKSPVPFGMSRFLFKE